MPSEKPLPQLARPRHRPAREPSTLADRTVGLHGMIATAYWNPNVDWEPREVYVLEVTMPKEHPYSKRTMYTETRFPRFYMTEHYDKSGQFVKFSQVLSAPT
jgi:hypothetical protein